MDVEGMLREIREELRSLRAEVRRGRVEESALLSLKDAARRLSIGTTKLRGLIKTGEILVTPLGGRRYVSASEIDRITSQREQEHQRRPRRAAKTISVQQDPEALRRWTRAQRG